MDPYAFIGQQLADGFYRGQERRDKKKSIEEEYAQRMRLLQEQNRLEANAPTAEMKNMEMFQRDPDAFQRFRQALDPMAGQEMALKQAQLQMQGQNYKSEDAYRQAQINAMNQRPNLPGRIQEAQWWTTQINPQTGRPYTFQEIQQFLYKPPFSFDFFGGGGGGGGAGPEYPK